jgi:hypothetical protein
MPLDAPSTTAHVPTSDPSPAIKPALSARNRISAEDAEDTEITEGKMRGKRGRF